MKRVAKIIGLVGGVAAVVWAMRDRFISVATSREPEPPTIRYLRAWIEIRRHRCDRRDRAGVRRTAQGGAGIDEP